MKKCPYCAENIQDEAIKCRYCGESLEKKFGYSPTESINNKLKLADDPKFILGIAGSIILFVGVFMPILSLPMVGNINYFKNGEGDGVFILYFAIASLILFIFKKFKWLWVTGLLSGGILTYTYINFTMAFSNMSSEMESSLADNPFKGIGDLAIQSVQIEWGWAILVIGVVLILIPAFLSTKEEKVSTKEEKVSTKEEKVSFLNQNNEMNIGIGVAVGFIILFALSIVFLNSKNKVIQHSDSELYQMGNNEGKSLWQDYRGMSEVSLIDTCKERFPFDKTYPSYDDARVIFIHGCRDGFYGY